MHRSFSLRRHRSQPQVKLASDISTIPEATTEEIPQVNTPDVTRGLSKRLLRRFHSRSHSRTNDEGLKTSLVQHQDANGIPVRSRSRREKIVHVIANPDSLFKQEPAQKEPTR
jgi:hypothetical protein